jgi:hypothetical protein
MASDGLMQFMTQALFLIPVLLVGVLGIVLLFSLPVPARVRALAVAGLAIIMVDSLGNVAFFTWYSQMLASGGGGQSATLMGVVRLISTVVHAFGLALLVAAAVAGRGIKAPF